MRGKLYRVPSIVRRASSATPVPVVNFTFSLLLSGLRLSFKGDTFCGWWLLARQYFYSVDLALAAFCLREGLFLFLSVKFLFQVYFLVNGLLVEVRGS